MSITRRAHFLLETGIRIVADAVMVNVAWAAAMIVRLLVEVRIEGHELSRTALSEYANEYTASFGLLTVISVLVFYLSGFYTRGRYYQGKYKALVVMEAVSLAYLIFGFIAFLARVAVTLPRSVLLSSWLLTCLLLLLARFWSMLWKNIESGYPVKPSVSDIKPQGKSVLVIGGAGYIGSALLPKLLDRGYKVRLLDLFIFGKQPVSKVLGHPNLEVIQADFRRMDQVVQAMRGMDMVVHLGAIVGDPACSLDQELTVEVNLIATRMIAEVAKGSGIERFCFASTCSVYGANDDILDERSELNPISLYARSKLASERVLLKMNDATFCPVILRFGTVYGFSGRTRFDLIINLLTAKAVVDGKVTVLGGRQWRPFVHVSDAAAALLKIVEAPRDLIHGEVFNVGSSEQNYRLEDAARIIQSFVPTAVIEDMGAGTDFRNYRVDCSKLSNLLGFTPQWKLEDGVTQVIRALNSGEINDYRDPMYSNVKFLSEESNLYLIRRETGWAYDLINEKGRTERSPVVTVTT